MATATSGPDSSSGEETATSEPSEPPDGDGEEPLSTPEGGATSTLIPFPTITIEIPLVTPPERLKVMNPNDQKAFTKTGDGLAGSNFGRFLPLVLIGLVWVILGAWFFYLQRKME